MFILYLLLDVLSFSVKFTSFGFALFSSTYSFFQENINASPTLAVCHKRDSKSVRLIMMCECVCSTNAESPTGLQEADKLFIYVIG